VHVVDLRARRVLTALPALVRYLRRTQPVAMASVLDHANVVALWARRIARAPRRVVVIEQNTLSQVAGNASSWRDRILPRVAARFYPWADSVVGVSASVAEDLLDLTGLPPERVHVVFNPIVSRELHDMARAPAGHAWFEGDEPVAVAVGRLRPQKDFPTLLRAFAKAREGRRGRLIILGDGPERPRRESLIGELGLEEHVDLPGFTSNPYAFMSRACAFVLSSRWEGLPTVLIEALSCGTPVVATDCPSGPREILDGGRFGTLVPVGDVDALADGIAAALDGALPRPPEESWRPYELDVVVGDYLDLMIGER